MKIRFNYTQYDDCALATLFSFIMNMILAVLSVASFIMLISLPYGIYESIANSDLTPLLIGSVLGVVGALLFVLEIKVISPLIDKISDKIAEFEREHHI